MMVSVQQARHVTTFNVGILVLMLVAKVLNAKPGITVCQRYQLYFLVT